MLAALAGPVAAAPTDTLTAPPQLITTSGGGGPKAQSVEQLRKAAAKGDGAAAFELGVRSMNGTGVPLDTVQARSYFEQAAKGGVADALFRLGKIYCDGTGVDQDFAKGFSFYTEAAARGVPEAQHNVGAMLVSGRGVKRDYVEGLAWIIVARQSGAESDAEAQVRAHLAKRPADIAAAEARAVELEKNLGQAKPVAPKATVLAPPVKPADVPAFQPEKAGPARIEVAAPKIEVPLAVPQPATPPDKP
jgi:TPR repeat protein